MRTYGQYCPIARGAEIFAEPWTPVIIRNMYVGCASMDEIMEGAPGLSRSLLSERLERFERLGIVSSVEGPGGEGRYHELTRSGHDLFHVCMSLGEWGAGWLEMQPEHLDPFIALWVMSKTFRWDQIPAPRVVARFDFTGRELPERYWMHIELGDTRVCRSHPGLEEDLAITADTETFIEWHAGHCDWAEAVGDSRIRLEGSAELVETFPNWNLPSVFAHVVPQVGRSAG